MVNFENEQTEALARYFMWDIDEVRNLFKTYHQVIVKNADDDFLYVSILNTESGTFEDYVLNSEGNLTEHNRVEVTNGSN